VSYRARPLAFKSRYQRDTNLAKSKELYAMADMNKPCVPVFACEIDKKVKHFILHAHNHCLFYDDVLSDDFLKAPTVDLFVAGFPCQSYSSAGLNNGVSDIRGIVVFRLIQYIMLRLPTTFVLENVEGLIKNHKETFCLILQVLDGLTDATGKKLYLG
jgi:site-specific DNA-cytosine methylase